MLQMIGSAITPVSPQQPFGQFGPAASTATPAAGGGGTAGGGSVAGGMGYLGAGALSAFTGLSGNGRSSGYDPSNAAAIYAMQQGAGKGTLGNISSAVSAGQLANSFGAFGTHVNAAGQTVNGNTDVGGALSAVGGGLQFVQGIQRGGVQGYGSAAVGGLRAASGIESLMGNSAMAGTLGAAAGYIAAPLALYSAIKNWQSGNTGSDAIQGAEAGAAIGSIIPGVGTVIGAVVGGAVGALSSAFGGGRADPETSTFENYAAQYDKATPAQQQELTRSLSPAQSFQVLAGIFDSKNNSPGHATPQEQIWGRMGEGAFTNAVFGQINSAIKKDPSLANADPQTLYNKVVNPYLSSFKGNYGGGNMTAAINNSYTAANGTKFGDAMESAVVSLIGNWQNGNLTQNTPVGAQGQAMGASMPLYNGQAAPTQAPGYSNFINAGQPNLTTRVSVGGAPSASSGGFYIPGT